MAAQHDESAAVIQREIQETLLDLEYFGIEISNRFAVLGVEDHVVDIREVNTLHDQPKHV